MLSANLTAPITKTEEISSFEVLRVEEDYQNKRVVATVQAGETQLPLILWADADYDQSYNWTNAAVIARVKELLPAALA